jgi:DnaJ-class molecular chaperone
MIPQSLTEKQRQLMEELSKEFDVHVGETRKGFKDKVRDFFDR